MVYEIGYRRPPKSGQFTKGKSGNPKGRAKGSKNFLTLLEKELGQSIVVSENGKKKKITRQQAMVKRIVASALNGDAKSIMLLVDVLKRTDQLKAAASEASLPNDYDALLDNFIAQRNRQKSST